jgi:hypothetical protein
MADKDLMYYVPPELRGPLSEAGRVGYNVLDNIIGFDDQYDTTGELLARSLREDPVGTAKGIASGAYEGLKGAVSDPVGTAEGMASEFLAALSRLREPLPEDASREEIAQRSSDLGLLASVVPVGRVAKAGGAAVRSGAHRLGDVVDTAQRAQADRFLVENSPSFSGKPFATTSKGEVQFYHPSQAEERLMDPSNPIQNAYMQRRARAEGALAQGFDPSLVGYDTSIVAVPRRTLTGEEYDPRLYAAVNPVIMEELRPDRATDYSSRGLKLVEDPKLRGNEAFFGTTKDGGKVIAMSSSAPASVFRHEMTHADQFYGDVPWEEIGDDPSTLIGARLDALDELKNRIKAAETPEEKRRLTAQRDEIKRATSYELYQRNPGEMLARLAQGNPTTVRSLSLTEALNPYIRPNTGLTSRAMGAFEQALRGERSGILSVPITKAMDLFGKTPGSSLYYDNYVRVPMDLDRALYDAANTDTK